MSTSAFIARRLLRSDAGSRLSTPIVRIAIAGIAIGISVMIVAIAIVTGFQQEIRAKVIGFGSHIQISKYDTNRSFESTPISNTDSYLKEVGQLSGVQHIQSFAIKAGIVKAGDAIEGVVYKGIGKDYESTFFQSHLKEGKMPVLPDSGRSNEVLISKTQAQLLHLKVGDGLLMYFVQDPPKARKFTVSGIYDTGLGDNDFDKLYVIGDIRVVQQLNKWSPDQVSGIEIQLEDFSKMDEMEQVVYQTIPNDLDAKSIRTRYPQLFSWLDLMDTNVYIIIALMMIVGIINMVTSLLIMILERTQLIGILKALGADNRLVISLFLRQAATLIGRGLLIGNVLGIGLCLLQLKTGMITLNQETYYLSVVPIQLHVSDILLLNAATFGICLVSLMLPALLVTRISPSRVMRFD
ncbi:MAG TPA: ABC transporter permease [Flavobacteriales bacterium]|nr:ABC transporter permease [Flavobacteriales bacterium]HPH81187.1 ABC transporter permease [Flavobacteriales bacterium]